MDKLNWESNLSEKERANIKVERIENLRSMIDVLKDPDKHIGWPALKALRHNLKKFIPSYISWEELGISEEEFEVLFKQGVIKTMRLELEIWRKEIHPTQVLEGLVSIIKEFISEEVCTYEELGTNEEELNKLLSLLNG